MALQGTLDTFALSDVMRLLAATSKTGRLVVTGPRGEGSVWLDAGAVVAASTESAKGVHSYDPDVVFFELQRQVDGEFEFAPGVLPTVRGEARDVEGLLARSAEALIEWHEIEAVVPSLDLHARLSPRLPDPEVVVDAGRWELIALIAGGAVLHELLLPTTTDELSLSRRIKSLVEAGLIELYTGTEQPPSVAPSSAAAKSDGPTAPSTVSEAIDLVASVATTDISESESEPEVPFDWHIETNTPSSAAPHHEPEDRDADGPSAQLEEIAAEPNVVPRAIPTPAFPGIDGPGLGIEIPGFSSLSKTWEPLEIEPEVEVYDDGPVELPQLSPAAARAIAQASQATSESERDAAIERAIALNEEPLDRQRVLRFVLSVRS